MHILSQCSHSAHHPREADTSAGMSEEQDIKWGKRGGIPVNSTSLHR